MDNVRELRSVPCGGGDKSREIVAEMFREFADAIEAGDDIPKGYIVVIPCADGGLLTSHDGPEFAVIGALEIAKLHILGGRDE